MFRRFGVGALTSVRIIGAGRAGRSFAAAWAAAGITVDLLGRDADQSTAAQGVDAVLIATADRAIADVAAVIEPDDAIVMHCSGATSLEALAPHEQRASIHPLMALPDAETGAARLADSGWFAVAGHALAGELVNALGGRSFQVPDEHRAAYHATAAVSANHLVALLGQVERLAALVGVPPQAFFDLAKGSFEDVVGQGAVAALTGPAARGDIDTLEAHRRALPPEELALYNALAQAAGDLATRQRHPSPPKGHS